MAKTLQRQCGQIQRMLSETRATAEMPSSVSKRVRLQVQFFGLCGLVLLFHALLQNFTKLPSLDSVKVSNESFHEYEEFKTVAYADDCAYAPAYTSRVYCKNLSQGCCVQTALNTSFPLPTQLTNWRQLCVCFDSKVSC